MADRVSTIRFRTDGAQAVTGSFEQISKKILAQQAMLERSQKIVKQKEAGAAMGITQSGLKKAQDQVLAAEKQMNSMIVDMDFAAEHTKFEVKQRMLDRQLQETLKKVEGNEKAQLAIRKAYALESQKILQQAMAGGGAVGGGVAGAKGRWQPGGYKTPQFGSMSDRFTAMFSVSAMMGNITGDMTLARNVGVAASGFLLGSPLFGAINAGAIGISAAIAKVRAENDNAKKSAKEYTDTLVEMSRTWSGLATELVDYNPFGSKMQSQIKQTEDAVLSLRLELAELSDDVPILFGRTGRMENIGQKWEELYLRKGEGERARELRNQEFRNQMTEERTLLNLQRTFAGTTPRGESGQIIKLDRQQRIESLKLEFEYKQKIRQADASIEQLRTQGGAASRKAGELGLDEKVLNERLAKAGAIRRAYEDAVEARARIQQQFGIKFAKQEAEQQQKRLDLFAQINAKVEAAREKHAKAIESQEIKSYRAYIRATTEGYEQKAALREVSFAVELKKAAEHGDEMVRLVKYMHEQMIEEERKANRLKIENTMAAFDAEASLMQYRRKMKEFGGIGATSEEQRKIESEMLVGRYNREIERERLTLALKRNQVTKTEADIQGMMAKDIRAQWTGPEGFRIRQSITDVAFMRRSIREQDAQTRISELLRQQNQRGSLSVGQFEAGKYHAGYVDFAKLHQEGQLEPLRQSELLKQIREILARIELAGPLQ